MKLIAGAKITFTKAALAGFSVAEKKAFYIFAHILNRTKLLEAQIFSQWQTVLDTQRSSIERDAALFGLFEFIILLAGELKEGWEAITICYHKSQLSKTLNTQLPEEVQKILKRLPDHFNGTSITHHLRNHFAYHHDPEKIFSAFQLLADDDLHIAYLFSEENNYFDYATKLRIAAVAESIGHSDWRRAVEHLVTKVAGEVGADVSKVLNAILATLIAKIIDCDHEAVELPSVPNETELAGHFFFYAVPPGY